MTVIYGWSWDHQEDIPGPMVNTSSAPPTTEQLITSDPDVAACWEIALAGNDQFDTGTGHHNNYSRPAADDSMSLQVRLKIEDLSAFDRFHVWLRSEGSSGSSFPGYLGYGINPDGSLTVYAATTDSLVSGTALGTSDPGLIQPGVWHRVSFRGIIDNTAGEAQLEVDGGEAVTFGPGDTWMQTLGSPAVNWGYGMDFDTSFSGTSYVRFEHLTLAQDEAAVMPPREYEWVAPTGETTDTDGTPTGAATSWEAVDEVPADGGTTFMSLPVGKQGFTFPNRAGNGTPRTVQMWGAVGDAAVGGDVVNVFFDDGTELDSPAFPINDSFAAKPLSDILEDNPSGGGLDPDALDAGFERTT